jgi:hypothetical protein
MNERIAQLLLCQECPFDYKCLAMDCMDCVDLYAEGKEKDDG